MQGYFTTRGLALSAKLAAGSVLTISRVVAGSGQTQTAATALSGPCQTLAVNSPTHSGNTAAIPATLTAAGASGSYTLTELGVYAVDPDDGEILYKIYRLSKPVDITAGSSMVLRFYLEETVSQDLDVDVTCSPAGLITEEIFSPVEKMVQCKTTSGRHVYLDAADLQAFLDGLPRMMTDYLTITLTGATDIPVSLAGFYGPGVIVLEAENLGDCIIRNQVVAERCSIQLWLHNLQLEAPADLGEEPALVIFRQCGYARVQSCQLTGNDVCRGIRGEGGSLVFVEDCTGGHFKIMVLVNYSSVVTVKCAAAEDFHDNDQGIYVWSGGIVLLAGYSSETLGGTYNTKSGGLITKVAGTLL